MRKAQLHFDNLPAFIQLLYNSFKFIDGLKRFKCGPYYFNGAGFENITDWSESQQNTITKSTLEFINALMPLGADDFTFTEDGDYSDSIPSTADDGDIESKNFAEPKYR